VALEEGWFSVTRGRKLHYFGPGPICACRYHHREEILDGVKDQQACKTCGDELEWWGDMTEEEWQAFFSVEDLKKQEQPKDFEIEYGPMTDERLAEIEVAVQEALDLVVRGSAFENMTCFWSPISDEGRRKAAGLVPEMLAELIRLKKKGG